MKNLPVLVARFILGGVFLIFGLNGFLHFMPMPPMPEQAGAFLGALAGTGYMFPLIKGTEVVAALLILSGRFLPLGLVLLAPVMVNILAFHLVLAPGVEGIAMPLVLTAAGIYLAVQNKAVFGPLVKPSKKTS